MQEDERHIVACNLFLSSTNKLSNVGDDNVDAGVDGYGDDGRITIIFGTDYFAMFMRRTTIANFYF